MQFGKLYCRLQKSFAPSTMRCSARRLNIKVPWSVIVAGQCQGLLYTWDCADGWGGVCVCFFFHTGTHVGVLGKEVRKCRLHYSRQEFFHLRHTRVRHPCRFGSPQLPLLAHVCPFCLVYSTLPIPISVVWGLLLCRLLGYGALLSVLSAPPLCLVCSTLRLSWPTLVIISPLVPPWASSLGLFYTVRDTFPRLTPVQFQEPTT